MGWEGSMGWGRDNEGSQRIIDESGTICRETDRLIKYKLLSQPGNICHDSDCNALRKGRSDI